MKGSGAAGVATIGAAGVEVIQDTAAETQAALQPLIHYIDTMCWLFVAAATDNLRRLPPKDPIATTG